MSSVFEFGKKSWSRATIKVFGLCALVLLTLIVATQFKNKTIHVNRILIDRLDGFEELSRAKIRALVLDEMLKQTGLRYEANEDGPATLRVAIGPRALKNNEKIEELRISMVYENQENLQLESVEIASISQKEQAEQEIRQSLQMGFENLHLQFKSESAKSLEVDEIFQAYLSGRKISREMLLLAIEKAKNESDKHYQDPLLSILPRADPEMSIQVLSALGNNGREEAVEPILEFSEQKGTEIRRHAIETVRKIGGKKAAAWLFTLSTGHPDERVREAATLAFADVEKRLLANR